MREGAFHPLTEGRPSELSQGFLGTVTFHLWGDFRAGVPFAFPPLRHSPIGCGVRHLARDVPLLPFLHRSFSHSHRWPRTSDWEGNYLVIGSESSRNSRPVQNCALSARS